MSETAAEIAARYGARLSPGVEVVVVPRGASARPLPVWNGLTLVCPDWKEERERSRRASLKARRVRAGDAAVAERRGEVGRLHATGATNAAIMAALGLDALTVKNDLYHLGLRSNRDPAMAAHLVALRQGGAEARRARVAALIAEGADEDRIKRELGLQDDSWLRKVIRSVAPDFPFRNRRAGCNRGRKHGPRPPTARQRAMAEKLAPLLTQGLTMVAIGAELGLSRNAVAGHIARLRAHGLLPMPGRARLAA